MKNQTKQTNTCNLLKINRKVYKGKGLFNSVKNKKVFTISAFAGEQLNKKNKQKWQKITK